MTYDVHVHDMIVSQALPNASIAEAEQEEEAAEEAEQEEEQEEDEAPQQLPSPVKALGRFGRTQAIKAQPPQAQVLP